MPDEHELLESLLHQADQGLKEVRVLLDGTYVVSKAEQLAATKTFFGEATRICEHLAELAERGDG